MIIPIIAGVGVAAYAAYELTKKPKPVIATGPAPAPRQTQRGVAPAGATDGPLPGSGAMQNVVFTQAVDPTPLPSSASLTAQQIAQQLAAINPVSPTPLSSAAAAEVAGLRATVQPQPSIGPAAQQPPLPPVPAAGIQSKRAIVNTRGAAGSQDSNLRIRSGPSTNAPVVPGGEPSKGGGIPKGTAIDVTGDTVSDMTPISWNGLTGWVFSGYLKAL